MSHYDAFIHSAKVLYKFEIGFLLKFDDLS